jgi:hypothetical protein
MVALVGAARRCLSAAAGGWHTAALEGRSVLRLEGADVYTYLQARPAAGGARASAPAARASPAPFSRAFRG